jgi:glutathione S-transferase
MAITFFYSPMSSATRVMWALEELGVPFEKVRLDLQKGDQRKPEFLAINPNGKVPAMVDGDAKLFESLAIVLHLGDRYGVEKKLWPAPGTAERAEAFAWCVWGTVTVLESALTYATQTESGWRYAQPADRRSPELAADAKKQWETCLDILERRLERQPYIVGDSFTLADVAVGPNVVFGAMAGKLPIETCRNVSAWIERCKARPAFARAMGG